MKITVKIPEVHNPLEGSGEPLRVIYNKVTITNEGTGHNFQFELHKESLMSPQRLKSAFLAFVRC